MLSVESNKIWGFLMAKSINDSRQNHLIYLTDYNTHDKPWDAHRCQSDDVGQIYAGVLEFERYAQRMAECSGVLRFGWQTAPDTGESRLRLREAHFCRVRHCPVCQWRRTLMWQARFYQAMPRLAAEHPKARWIFLTLTVKNCQISELRDTLKHMNASWQRLKDRKEFKPVSGWIRSTEVTRGKDGTAHPHFHALLMVPPSWFTRHYIKQARWVELWRECLRADYAPNVDVRAVKAKKSQDEADALRAAVAETLKYSTKPADMTSDSAWFLELTRQTHKMRFLASGGTLKDVLKVGDETNEDLILADGAPSAVDEPHLLGFNWHDSERRYKRAPNADKTL